MAKVSLRAYNREIETMIDRGQFDEAIAHCRHILISYPKHLETYRLLGKAYLESKRYGDAVDIFSRILTTVPSDFVSHVGMSIIRDEENNLDEAIWHMERAFETQPSNPAIQGELQRLYARRDGVRPPRIRMTRGALANMYVQGELYPQAISEINNVLKDDPERADMQALLARAYYRNGLKNDAADIATSLLRRYPYSLDANRVLVEILGSDHPESTQIYRQRVFELDPYAAHVAASVFLAEEVSDAAVNIERLDWDGQPVAMQPGWRESQAISLEAGGQPEWVDRPFEDSSGFGGIQSAPASIFGSTPEPQQPSSFGGIESAATPIFGSTPAPEEPPAQPAEEIPDFLRAAGWGAATGMFDESKSTFGEETANSAEPIEHGDLPDWIKAMKPAESEAPARQEEEELPDWIKTIGVGAIAARAFDQDESPVESQKSEVDETTQWLNSSEANSQTAPQDDLGDDFAWLKNMDGTEVVPAGTQPEDFDWMKGLSDSQDVPSEPQPEELDRFKNSEPAQQPPSSITEEADWLKGIGETQAASTEAQPVEPDWMNNLGFQEKATPSSSEELPDWLKDLSESNPAPAEEQTQDFDWLKNLGGREAEAAPSRASEEPDWLRGLGEPESTPATADNDQPDWLKGLAIAGGAAAISHLTDDESKEKPSSVPEPSANEPDLVNQFTAESIPVTPQESQPAAVDLDHLGTTEQDQDDSFAWLEGLAAKQGATEGLLTNPEDRLEEEPDWVKQAKGLTGDTSVPGTAAALSLTAASLDDLGKSEQDQDDSFAWLEGLAAKQGATEGLLTNPEDRLDEEPEWVKQAKDMNAQEVSPVTPATEMEVPVPGESETATGQPAPVDEVDAWLRNLEGEEQTSQTEPSADETAIWLRGLEQKETPDAEMPAETAADATGIWLRGLEERETPQNEEQTATESGTDLPEWMKNIKEGQEEKPSVIFAEEAELGSTWMPPTEEPEPVAESKAEDPLPGWLSELDKEEEEEQISTPADKDDLPAWLLAEETAPGIPEPTIFSDWRRAEESRQELTDEQESEDERPESETTARPAVSMEMPEAETVLEPEQIQAEPDARPETSGLNIPTVDPVLGIARDEISRNNIQGALDSYGKLIKKARYLDEVIFDLREALYRYPVDINLWQSLGDAYMRANRLQDALDAYTKAEELLR